ncbi:AraC family transcriptional regulator [Herbaspirillum seropedicae]|uniref:AraC family transcription regulator protein n=1 Tax=Herbaspirillum seropedicae (strain SmR1) TaxID=757424 RepID=D8IPI2_HERSS|nr:AraC family transcriptional regulator [Herbaspirillum seropedicae]ADJ64879.1 AraC family transcription regulator protein [Herbaspirillum seropedicae SmR1]MDR6395116.1 AraC-like DNA-binding protein [Herbaspirillum seropedicae]NQE28225.1 AraC family transcriptional regulator [Herbaspirillum seropedicae]UMU22773.1 AraC family transcriptional regulator [Herbaspirillum seropedicae]
MSPDLELVHTRQDQSFRAWVHDYPHTVAKWHFHPEYEVHVITASSGKFFVGDFIGDFGPGNLVLTGPNLPHNWVSNLGAHQQVPARDLVLQFSRPFAERVVGAIPELSPLQEMLDGAARGLQFPDALGASITPLMQELAQASGARRVVLMMSVLERLASCPERKPLAGPGYDLNAQRHMSSTLNQVLSCIRQNLGGNLRETDLAELAGMSVSSFTRFFKRHTGCTFIQYQNGLRLNEACELLMCTELSVTEVCYRVGFNNLSNFNRQFLASKGMPPSRFRSLHRLNDDVRAVA